MPICSFIIFCLNLILYCQYIKQIFSNLRCVPLFMIFKYIFNSKNVLTTPLFIEVPVPSQENDRSCICVLGLSIFASFWYSVI